MLTQEKIEQLATKHQTTQQNVVREYCQHLFLSYFYQKDNSDKVLFKGGTALKIVLGSERFSEDLDFSAVANINKREVENIFGDTLADIEKQGIDTNFEESKDTGSGYLGVAIFRVNGYAPINISIEVSFRDINEPINSEAILIASDFVPSYTLFHLPLDLLIHEKLKATLERQKPRDFYDVYFLLRRGLIKTEDKKSVLPQIKDAILSADINFRNELSQFLPASQSQIISNFRDRLIEEINRHLGY